MREVGLRPWLTDGEDGLVCEARLRRSSLHLCIFMIDFIIVSVSLRSLFAPTFSSLPLLITALLSIDFLIAGSTGSRSLFLGLLLGFGRLLGRRSVELTPAGRRSLHGRFRLCVSGIGRVIHLLVASFFTLFHLLARVRLLRLLFLHFY